MSAWRTARAKLRQHRVSALGGEASLAGVRAGFALGERISPRLAAAAAQRVWFRVPPAPPAARRDRGVPPGRPLEVAVEGRPLNVRSWGSGPVVLLVHGWSGWWQQLSVYVEPLVAAGFQVVAWDGPSHGDSAPGRYGRHASSVADLTDGVLAVGAAVRPVHGIVAHSAGAMAACVALAGGVSPERVVLVSPSVSGADQIDFLVGRLGWGPRTTVEVERYVARRFGLAMTDYDIPTLIADTGLELPPALFIADADDTEVPPDSPERLAAAWPNAQTIQTAGLDHFRVLWSPETVAAAVEFIAG